MEEESTRIGDLPERVLAQVISSTCPRDAVWERFLRPPDYDDDILYVSGSGRHAPTTPLSKEAFRRRLSVNGGSTAGSGGGGKCVTPSARKLSLPWDDDGESRWRWTSHPYIP
ncbi:uncharacterized protein LOC104584028 [Brachypodium distachyon]|uniref:F-box domain-containing protein n=1 Tax=Brachypodium distachyon TaxID=15368 RepID=A0A0Q3Q0B7_BRADI|nr:uncharacterized protein LOC104584028 [Brachypodium distachyon]KQJ95089.1 hypothetical protein BRADI_3g15145v3 [Brachypodium distachyon]|eukprot:XP_010236426.1 uncharacterized protein LOC104584028 [Brachypodium distachyon]